MITVTIAAGAVSLRQVTLLVLAATVRTHRLISIINILCTARWLIHNELS